MGHFSGGDKSVKADNLSFVDISPHRLLALFNLLLGYVILNGSTTRISAALNDYFGLPQDPVNLIVGGLLFGVGLWLALFAHPGLNWIWASVPIMVYNAITLMLVIQLSSAPSGGEVVSLFTLLYMVRDFRRAAREVAYEHAMAELLAIKKVSPAPGEAISG